MATLINGINFSWGNLSLVLFNSVVIGVTEIEYKEKQVKENNYGMGQQPVSRGYGNEEYEGSITMYLDEWKRIIKASPNNKPLSIAPSDIQICFAGSRILPNKDVLKMVEFLENPMSAKQGDTKLLVTIPLIIGGIEREGI
mgnify:CR=1 FL=1